MRISESIWYKFSQYVNITKHSKSWLNKGFHDKLTRYRSSKMTEDWRIFKHVIKKTKCLFFDDKIQEITSKNQRPWDYINWVKKCKLLAIESLQYNRHSYTKINDLWQMLYQIFNFAQNCQVNLSLLNEIPLKHTREWLPFSKEEFKKCH